METFKKFCCTLFSLHSAVQIHLLKLFIMPSHRYFSTDFKQKIVDLFQSGKKKSEIAKSLIITKSAVTKIIQKYDSRGDVRNAPKSGRPRKTTSRMDQTILRISKLDPRKSSGQIKNEISEQFGIEVTSRTVRNRLRDGGLYGRVAVKKPLLSKKNRKARMEFARAHISWSKEKWNTVLWSDESKFKLFGSDGRQYVRRPVGARFKAKYQIPTVKHGGGNVMVWGCFSRSGTGPIIQVQGKMDRFQYKEILENTMLPFAEDEMPLRWIFQQDNDPKHSSKLVKEWFGSKNINVLEWPSQSPDLNPIEHLWEVLDRRIRMHSDIKNQQQLFGIIESEWSRIPAETLQKLVDSMPRRCQAVLDSRGYSTKY